MSVFEIKVKNSKVNNLQNNFGLTLQSFCVKRRRFTIYAYLRASRITSNEKTLTMH